MPAGSPATLASSRRVAWRPSSSMGWRTVVSGVGVAGHRRVLEADHGHVVGDAPAGRAERQRARGHQVGGGEHGVDRRARPAEEAVHGRGLVGEVAGLDQVAGPSSPAAASASR